jgi:ankyrin repeat protein
MRLVRRSVSPGLLAVILALSASCHAPYEGLGPEETLIEAAKTGDAETVRSLLQRKVDVTYVRPRGSAALLEAASFGHTQIVQALLAAGAPVDQVNTAGLTALMAASMSGRLDIVRILIAAGADVNSRGAMGPEGGPTTALLMSITYCQTDVIRELIKNGATIQFYDDKGRLALNAAREYKCRELVPVLEQALQRELDHG